VLHGDQGARTGKGSADADFQRHLFIGRPLRPSADGVESFKNLRRRRAGIAGAKRHAGVERGLRHGFIAARESAFGIVLGHGTSASKEIVLSRLAPVGKGLRAW
jgi:hypothetical protein